ncbi:hypothetical protein STSP2_01403 [Anaerohalosphaera lusitana]|uniref:Uncharacterized protein n=1 Tax=Anaerohalosphaera lusitana TaxID=1936003 RepID=A0A1U9NKB0_9BACT|nr:hypothetical protein STSP2_01403 [Anaerohalosphaera lusitana]
MVETLSRLLAILLVAVAMFSSISMASEDITASDSEITSEDFRAFQTIVLVYLTYHFFFTCEWRFLWKLWKYAFYVSLLSSLFRFSWLINVRDLYDAIVFILILPIILVFGWDSK